MICKICVHSSGRSDSRSARQRRARFGPQPPTQRQIGCLAQWWWPANCAASICMLWAVASLMGRLICSLFYGFWSARRGCLGRRLTTQSASLHAVLSLWEAARPLSQPSRPTQGPCSFMWGSLCHASAGLLLRKKWCFLSAWGTAGGLLLSIRSVVWLFPNLVVTGQAIKCV